MSPLDLDATLARDTATMLRNIAASAFNVPAGHLNEALNALELGAIVLDEREALVAQLRAARDCVDALRTIVSDDRTYYAQLHHQHYAEQTLELYDKAAEEARS